ncbi:MAG TPA: beta-L-arabinofuranosidase domain-containing protein [Acidimicrobiales bacterium]|nr:beta-L-arabinofuranosidase domain-containing protein [Acidimicrobiales bacterium]
MSMPRTLAGPVQPTAGSHVALRPLDGGAVRLSGGFWGERQALNREVTIPHGIRMLEEWGSLDNLRAAAGQGGKDYRLPLFMDSDVYKVLEAIAWDRQHGRVPAHEDFYAATASLLAAAQRPDGYLNSYAQVVRSGERFADPAMGHEMYCAGHLFQAAVAEARSGGEPEDAAPVGAVANRFASYLVEVVPTMPTFVNGHPEVETALTELYRQEGRAAFLALAEDFLGRRGRSTLSWGSFHADYFQDDVPVADADRVRGHAVRALYLLSGIADVYAETGRQELLRSCLAQWEDMTAAKTYLTGGVGSRHEGESFGEPFELPPDRAYCETCAAVASIMWNWRMCLVTGQARFAELLERTLYNGFLSGWGLDGKSFFYVNPLQSRGGVARRPWYRCACCPPNVMRMVASLEHYVATRTPDGVQLHQFMPAVVQVGKPGGWWRARVETGYPYEGVLLVRVAEAPEGPMDLAIRAPSWAGDVQAHVSGSALPGEPGPDGYLHLRRRWEAGDELRVEFPVHARVTRAGTRVDAVRGCFALERGPLVYCFETLEDRQVTEAAPVAGLDGMFATAEHVVEHQVHIGKESVVELQVRARHAAPPERGGWPYYSGPLPSDTDATEVALGAVPYFAWSNRGPSQMRVWLPERREERVDRSGANASARVGAEAPLGREDGHGETKPVEGTREEHVKTNAEQT